MKVRFIAPKSGLPDAWLKEGTNYTVLEVSIDDDHGVMYRLLTESEPTTPALHSASLFSIVSDFIPVTWGITVENVKQGGLGLTLAPRPWSGSFWERYFDGDDSAREIFERERDKILSEENKYSTGIN